MNLFKRNHKDKIFKEENFDTLESYNSTFITTDGIAHTGVKYNYINSSQLNCSASDYIMISINSNGYMKDKDRVIYPLTNVVSIKWNLLDEIKIPSRLFNHGMLTDVFYTSEEVNDLIARI